MLRFVPAKFLLVTPPKRSFIKKTRSNLSPAAPKARTFEIPKDTSDAPNENSDPAVHIKVIVHYPDIFASPDKNSDTNPHSRRTVDDLNVTSDPPDENSDPAPHERTAHYPDVPDTSESPDDKEERPGKLGDIQMMEIKL